MKTTLLLAVVALVVAFQLGGNASLAFQSPVSPLPPPPPAEDHRVQITVHNTPTPLPPPASEPTATPTIPAPAVLPETGRDGSKLAGCLGVLLTLLMMMGIAVAASRRRCY